MDEKRNAIERNLKNNLSRLSKSSSFVLLPPTDQELLAGLKQHILGEADREETRSDQRSGPLDSAEPVTEKRTADQQPSALKSSSLDLPQPAAIPLEKPSPTTLATTGLVDTNRAQFLERLAASTSLETLRPLALSCSHCPLAKIRQQVVFGEGAAEAEILFIGEGPGKSEDESGRPFVGRAGRLLDAMILSLGMPRSSIFIANIVKCRPPENRVPTLEEASSCRPILEKQISLLQPKLIVALGATAAANLLKTNEPITKARQKLYQFLGIPLICTFHPAYLLRNRTKLSDAYQDYRYILDNFQTIRQASLEKTAP